MQNGCDAAALAGAQVLLKAKLDGQGPVYSSWDEEVLDAYSKVVKPFLERMREEAEQFEELFRSIAKASSYGGLKDKAAWEFEASLLNEYTSSKDWTARMYFGNPKMRGLRDRVMHWDFTYRFDNREYSLSWKVVTYPDGKEFIANGPHRLISKPYGIFPAASEIDKWVRDSCNAIYAEVERMVEEADA